MKRIYIIIAVLLLSVQVKAQLVYDKWGDIIPFSLTEKYKDKINTKEIHSLILPSYNNDSLCRKYNDGKSANQLGDVFAAGISSDTLIRFKENAKCFKISEGTVWIYTIESPTSENLGIFIKEFDVPKGAYFSVMPGYPYEFQEPETYISGEISQRIKTMGLHMNVEDIKLIIEYYEPHGLKTNMDYTINQIDYGYVGFGQRIKKKLKEPDNNGNILKSGIYEDPNNPPLSCQYDITCQDVSSWSSEANAVVYIRMSYYYNNNKYVSSGTGFFINKAGGYTGTDQPILITCGHLYAPEVSSGTYYDISNSYFDMMAISNYENEACNSQKTIYGKKLPGQFNLIDLGQSYNPGYGTYIENEDYAILQTSRSISQLSKFNLLYAAWTANPNYQDNGYAAIGHPQNTVKKINVENSYAPANSNYFGLYFDKGVSEHGFSGSPVFNSSKKVVGWLCTGTGNCSTVGVTDYTNRTTCGRFDDLHSSIAYLIDPNLQYESLSSNPPPPTPPGHCSNCVQDVDETGIDCGGSCLPCGMADVLTLKSALDLTENGTINSRYEIFAEPDANEQLILSGSAYSLEAGMNIELKSGFAVERGTNFSAAIDQELMTTPPRGCQENVCVSFGPGLTPNGDGYNDFLLMGQAFVSEYSIEIFNRWNQLVYTAFNQPTYENGIVRIWDGTGAGTNGAYLVGVEYKDCNGNNHFTSTEINVIGLTKSASVNNDNQDDQDIATGTEEIISNDTPIFIFPNPAKNRIYIQSTSCDSHKYAIMDMTGKVLKRGTVLSGRESVDISMFPGGTYIIQVRKDGEVFTEKIIKQ